MIALLFATTLHAADGPIETRNVEGGTLIESTVPVEVAVLLARQAADGNTAETAVVRLAPGASARLDSEDMRVIRVEPLTGDVRSKARTPACSPAARAPDLLARVAELQADPEAERQRMQTAARAAQLIGLDVLDAHLTAVNDPLKRESERIAAADAAQNWDTAASTAQAAQLTGEAAGTVTAMAFSLAFAFQDAQYERRSALADQATRLEPIVAAAEARAQTHTAWANGYALLADGEKTLMDLMSGALPLPSGVEVRTVTRACAEAAALRDEWFLEAVAPDDVGVLVLRARFDDGSEQPVAFRRVGGSTLWLAKVTWPLRAASAQPLAPSADRWIPVGAVLEAGRVSAAAIAEAEARAARQLRARQKALLRRAAGSDVSSMAVAP